MEDFDYLFTLVDCNDAPVHPEVTWTGAGWNSDIAFNKRTVNIPNSGIARVVNQTTGKVFHVDWAGRRDGADILPDSFVLPHLRYLAAPWSDHA